MTHGGRETHFGLHNRQYALTAHGFRNVGRVYWNLPEANLFEAAVRHKEGDISRYGALVVKTGVHTGRSAQDKFVVAHPSYENEIWWDNNKRMDVAAADRLFSAMMSYAQGRDLFVQDLYGGADPEHKISVRVVTEYAWHSLFIRNLLIRPARAQLEQFAPEFLIVDLPGFQAVPERHGCRSETVIACDFAKRIILIGGTSYAGEIKKSVFTILNYLLPGRGTMPMHCSANVGRDGKDAAIFFGLSGTGKTTLSADPSRILIGDDEHGWSKNGVFNFEGGCYAKTINLSPTAEPEIFAATQRFGTILENVVMAPETREPDFDDGSLTQNARAAYPLHYIANASQTGMAGHPKTVIMLTCDAFGVMPPLAMMTPDQAMFHFLSGYTAKVAGTEKGVTEPEATFSTCFGAPFMPRHPSEYGNLLRDLIARHNARCWLVNTGWTGGPYGTGTRMPIKATRALLSAALTGSISGVEMREDGIFGFGVPVNVPDVDSAMLDPRATWADAGAFDRKARDLANRFVANFDPFCSYVDESVKQAAPRAH